MINDKYEVVEVQGVNDQADGAEGVVQPVQDVSLDREI